MSLSGSSSPSASLHSLSNSPSGNALDLLSGSKAGASIYATSGNSLGGESVVRDGSNNSASRSLESIMRKSSSVSLASKPAEVAAAATDQAGNALDAAPSTIQEDETSAAAKQGTAATTSPPVTPPFIGTVLEGHSFTPAPAEPEPMAEETSASPTERPSDHAPLSSPNTGANEPQAFSEAPETSSSTSKEDMSDSRSSLSAFATWWSGGNTGALNSTNLNRGPEHEKAHNQEHGLSVTTSTTSTTRATSPPYSTNTTPSSPSTAKLESPDRMDWEPSGPEAAFIQKSQAGKDNTGLASSTSLPSSLPSSASFPTSMIRHSKLAASVTERRGSTSSTQSSLTSILWSKLAASQDNVATTESSCATNDSTKDSTSAAATPRESNSTEMDMGPPTKSGLAIAPAHAKGTSSPVGSGKKRWSLFGYGTKDDDEDLTPTTKLRKSGDVLIEPESRPSSVKEAPHSILGEDTTFSEPSVANTIPATPSAVSPQAVATVKTELALSAKENGAVAPALVGTSELSVAAVKSNGTVSSTSSWLSLIPGYSTNMTEETPPTSDSMHSSHQITDYEEGERKDVNGNTVKLAEKPAGRTLAQLAEARNSKEVLASKEELKQSRKDLTLTQLKERDDQEGSLAKEAGKAVASLSKVILKKKNVVLPNYYDQYPDVRQSLITLPVGPLDIPIDGLKHERSSSIVKSAVSALSSLLFSKAPSEQQPSPTKDDALHRGTSGIKKVAIIGVHGWFPVKLIRTVIGEPTGTSKKFCDEMNLALNDYLKMHNVELAQEDITLIPLEGEGRVMDRVETLYQNLAKNEAWKTALHEADLVLVATHSQGTPTSTLLIARLIDEGMLRVQEDDPKMQRVGILAMAGISHGPFPSLKGNLIVRWFEAEAAQELFEFMDTGNEITKKYREALKTVLTSGVRFTLVASLEDQVVPLYSAIMTAVHHPSIVRAVYIDGASYQDDFLTNLISFSLRLRNSGVDDHGVLVHLSEVVAGSIYGEGHSTIYEEREVYMLAIRSLLEPPESLTSEMARSEPILHHFRAKQNLNPFYLPWGMRGVMDEIKVLGNEVLNEEMERLKELYDEWNPVTKGMKEIKFRLEPVRSKL